MIGYDWMSAEWISDNDEDFCVSMSCEGEEEGYLDQEFKTEDDFWNWYLENSEFAIHYHWGKEGWVSKTDENFFFYMKKCKSREFDNIFDSEEQFFSWYRSKK